MKNQSYIYLACILFMYACGSDSDSNTSEEEAKKDIHRIYLAETTFKDVFDGTIGDAKNIDVKNVYVSESAILDTLSINISRNNIAVITYENLSTEERELYGYIGVDISRKNKEKDPFTFSMKSAEKMNNAKKVAYQFAETISNASYQDLESILDPGFNPKKNTKEIQEYFSEITASTGKVINHYYYGAGEGKHESKTYYSFLGTLVYGNGMTQNFYVNVFEGSTFIEAYNISPLNMDPIDLQ
ncbi:MAG: hypothetical protein ACI9Y7_001940 [Dokdonia sp.]|jgi:hypothetical protein